VILRCTKKLLAVIRPRQLINCLPDGEDWYANLLWLSGRKCLLLRDDEHAALERIVRAAGKCAQETAAGPAGAREEVPHRRDVVEQLRHFLEHDECGRAASGLPTCVCVYASASPSCQSCSRSSSTKSAAESGSPAAERFADAEDVGDIGAGPELADPSEPGVDRVDDEKRTCLVAAPAQCLEEPGGRHPRACASLHGLDDDARRVARQRAWILAERAAMHRPRGATAARRPELLESRRREGEQSRAVIGAVEGDDARPPVARCAVRSAISTASSPVTPSFAATAARRGSGPFTSASARSPSACTTSWTRHASRMRGSRWPSAATPKPAERSSSSRPSVSVTRQPSAFAQITTRPSTRSTVAFAIVPAIAGFSLERRSEYWYPLLAERHVHAEAVAVPHELACAPLAHA